MVKKNIEDHFQLRWVDHAITQDEDNWKSNRIGEEEFNVSHAEFKHECGMWLPSVEVWQEFGNTVLHFGKNSRLVKKDVKLLVYTFYLKPEKM